jgi:hypothetical protein
VKGAWWKILVLVGCTTAALFAGRYWPRTEEDGRKRRAAEAAASLPQQGVDLPPPTTPVPGGPPQPLKDMPRPHDLSKYPPLPPPEAVKHLVRDAGTASSLPPPPPIGAPTP